MDLNELAYVVETNKSFDVAVVSVLRAVEQKGWALFNVYDVKERLAAKGFTQEPLKIIEICSAKHSNQLLNKDRLASLCMPCRIIVLEEKGKVKIASIRPSMISDFFPQITIEETKSIEKDTKEIIDSSK